LVGLQHFNLGGAATFQSWRGRNIALGTDGLAAAMLDLECIESFLVLSGE
jgi:hypothetical protein